MPRWTENKGLSLKDIREMHHACIVAGRAGRPLRGFLTMTPLRSVSDERRRALFQDQRSRLRQRLARPPFKQDFIGLFVREKKADDIHDAGEHCGALLWLPDDIDTDTLLRCLSTEIDAQLDWNNGEVGIKARLDYLQKERANQANGYLKAHKPNEVRYAWEAPAPLIAPRWSMTNGLAELVAADAAEKEQRPKVYLGTQLKPSRAEPEPLKATVACEPIKQTNVPDAMVKKSLFDGLPDMRAPERPNASPRHRDKIAPAPMLRLFSVVGNVDIIEAMRGVGPTQKAIAERVGISRSHATNIINSQFRPSRAVVRRVLELARAA